MSALTISEYYLGHSKTLKFLTPSNLLERGAAEAEVGRLRWNENVGSLLAVLSSQDTQCGIMELTPQDSVWGKGQTVVSYQQPYSLLWNLKFTTSYQISWIFFHKLMMKQVLGVYKEFVKCSVPPTFGLFCPHLSPPHCVSFSEYYDLILRCGHEKKTQFTKRCSVHIKEVLSSSHSGNISLCWEPWELSHSYTCWRCQPPKWHFRNPCSAQDFQTLK